MKTLALRNTLICGAAFALLAGFQSAAQADGYGVSPIVLTANEQIIRDQLIIIVDETGSIGSRSTFRLEKDLVQAFTRAMPNGNYMSGIDSFAGVPRKEWLNEPLARFVSSTMTNGADNLKALGSLTPLSRSILAQMPEMKGKGGQGALLIYSDGKVRNPEEVLSACRELKAAHGGELCIFTVQVGDSDRGRELLQDMANATGCGQYYDGNTLTSDDSIYDLVRDVMIGTREVVAEVAATPVAVDWSLDNIHFDNDSSVIGATYQGELDKAAGILKSHPELRIVLVGHTDSNATNEYNQKLSERRVDAARSALVDRGANAAQFELSAFGETRPEVPNTSPENLHTNRRVELSIVQ